MSLPKYPAYKDSGVSWLGEVPAHWEIRTLKSLAIGRDAKFIDGDWIESKSLSDTGIRYYTTGNVGLGFFKEQGQGYISDETYSSLGCTEVFPGDIFISRLNAPIGRACLVPSVGSRIVTSVDNVIFRPDLNWNRSFLVYALSAPYYLAATEVLASGATMQRIARSELGAVRLVVPERNEQDSIALFLDRETAKIDALIAEQEKLIALLAEKRQATISRAVTRGLDPNVPLKDSGVPWLGKVPAHWKACPLRYLAKVGNGSTPSRDNAAYWAETGFPWLNSSVVNQDEVTESDQFVTDLALKECHLPVVTPPAVLMGITGQGKTRGMVAKLGFVATVNQHLAYIKPSSEMLDEDFLLRVFESAYEYLRTESDGAGSTKGAITCDQVSRLHIPLPEIGEQVQIAAYLNQMTQRFDSLKEEALTAVTLLKERRAALISAAVTGKIDVRQL